MGYEITSSTWLYTTTSQRKVNDDYLNHAADVTYGTILCLCFLLGTVGNIVSFLYFKAKKRDISSVVYMLITANDIAVSVAVVPVGISEVFISEVFIRKKSRYRIRYEPEL